MNKKILSIIFSLFLVGVFSVSCSSKEDPKGIEQYNGNIYASESKDIFGYYFTVKIPDSVGMPKFTLEFSADGSTVNAEITYLINDGTEPHDEKYKCVKKN